MTATDSLGPIIYFDGVCNLCNSSVQFVIKHDKNAVFRFAALQSPAGIAARAAAGTAAIDQNSVLLYYRGRYYSQSDAALHILRLLGGVYALLFVGIIVPRFIRNGIYRYIAAHRYKWFGQTSECIVPTPELAGRFI